MQIFYSSFVYIAMYIGFRANKSINQEAEDPGASILHKAEGYQLHV